MEQPQVYNFDGNGAYGNGWGGFIPGFLGGVVGGAIFGNGEAVGYMSGDAAFLLAEDICEHGCPHCKTEKETT